MRTGANSTFGQFVSIVPLGIAICGIGLTVIAAHMVGGREQIQSRLHTQSEARHVSAQLRAGLGQTFEPLRRMAAWWLLQGKPFTPEDWENDAQLFVSTRAGLQKIIWLDSHRTPKWVARPGSVPESGRNFKIDAALATALKATNSGERDSFSPVFSSDGASVIYACAPVKQNGSVTGYIVGFYDFEALVRSVLEDQGPEQYVVTIRADNRSFRVGGRRNARAEFAHDTRVRVENLEFGVTVAPVFGVASGLQGTVTGFGVLASALVWVWAGMARTSRRRAKDLEAANARLVVENQERRRAEQKVAELNANLQHRLEEFQTLIDVLPVGIAVAQDPACRHIWTNRELAKMLRVPMGANVSRSAGGGCRILRQGVEVPVEDLPMQMAVRTRAAVANIDLDLVRDDGSVLHTLSYAAPLFDEAGGVRGVIDVCVDITERKALEDRLQQAEKFQSLALMAGGIAHDFNNLLTVIIGNASAMSRDIPEAGRSRRSLHDLEAAAQRAAELVGKLLAFTGRFWYAVTPMSLSREIKELKPAVAQIVPPAVAVDYDLDPDLPPFEAGPAELRRIVESLVANSVESFGEGHEGRIEIRTSECELSMEDIDVFYPDQAVRPGRYVRLEVSDDGCGIPEEILGRVFDPFFTTKFVGRGLGLSAVHGIARAHGGAVRVTSTLHHGTRVEVIFPAVVEAPAPGALVKS